MNNRENILGFVAGACAGVAAAMLLAPQAGTQTRRQIRDAGASARERVRSSLRETKDRIQQTTGRIQYAGSSAVSAAKEAWQKPAEFQPIE